MDLTQKLEDRAVSYEASGPSAHHTAALLREAKEEIERLREAIIMADNRLETAVYKIGDEVETCEHCIALARSYLSPYLPNET